MRLSFGAAPLCHFRCFVFVYARARVCVSVHERNEAKKKERKKENPILGNLINEFLAAALTAGKCQRF